MNILKIIASCIVLIFIKDQSFAMNNEPKKYPITWIAQEEQKNLPTSGRFTAHLNQEPTLSIEYEILTTSTPTFTQKIKNLTNLLATIYTQSELQFAKKHPEAIKEERFLSSLAPYFKDEYETIDWNLVEEKISTIFHTLFTTTDFSKFSKSEDIHIFALAKNTDGEQLGVIQFLIAPEYPAHSVKIAYFGVLPSAQDQGLELLLTSFIFKLIPQTENIFLHTRSTNKHLLGLYQAWGFKVLPEKQRYWTELEYNREHSPIVQRAAQQLV